MASGITLKVSPDELKSKAGDIKNQINKVQKDWNKISELIENSKGYWEGDASETHRKSKKAIESDVANIIKRMNEHPTDLLNMAGIYIEAENKAIQLANTLPGDVIV